ncbi:MAG: hypothetical protein ABJ004_18140 [Cyclobacteriaceae bacterium]
MNLKKILIASVLKPVDDVRLYSKLACSLAKANKYEIFILGKGTGKKSSNNKISFCENGNFGRISLKRFGSQFYLARLIQKLKPDTVIITAIELLPLAVLLKPFFGFKIFYDVIENYRLNVKHQQEYGAITKLVLLPVIAMIETLTFWAVDHFLLAEKSYQYEMKNLGKRLTVLQNKTVLPHGYNTPIRWQKDAPLKLLFSGSISHYSGIIDALKIFEEIEKFYPNVELKIIGSCQEKTLHDLLIQQQNANLKIKLFVDSDFIPHHQIEQAISESNLGIISYTPTPTNQNRIPTKMFEYAAFGLPYLYHHNPSWVSAAEEVGGGIAVDIGEFDAEYAIKKLTNTTKWGSPTALWSSEEQKFINLFY